MAGPIVVSDRRVAPLPPPGDPPPARPGTVLARVEALLARGRELQGNGDFAGAESEYRRILGLVPTAGVGLHDRRIFNAHYNLATTLRDLNRPREAAEVIAPLRRTRDGLLTPDADLHALYADLRVREGRQWMDSGSFGTQPPLVSGGAITYAPEALAAFREGASASLDLKAVLAVEGVRAALGDALHAQFVRIQTTGLTEARSLYGAKAALIQQSYLCGEPQSDRRWTNWFMQRQAEVRTLGER